MECKGTKNDGSPCRAFPYTDKKHPAYGYCFRCAQKKGLVSDDEVKAFEEKRQLGRAEARKNGTKADKREEKKKLALENISTEKRIELQNEALKKKQEARELIHKIIGDQNFDAEQMVADLKEVGVPEKWLKEPAKFVFLSWMVSDHKTRKPQMLIELCRLLEISVTEGREWMTSDWFMRESNDTLQRMMKLMNPYLQRINIEKALLGDFNAFKEYNKTFGKYVDSEGESNWEGEFTEDQLAQMKMLGEMN
jgi:hypothetical protein